jgi:hypothetical protein
MKTKTILALLSLALGAALTSTVRGADITPAETRAIAEEGFIYGLPIVMNYAVMYEYAVDRDSGQFKAPFNQIKKRSPCLHLQGHGDHNSEQRHAVFDTLAGSAC